MQNLPGKISRYFGDGLPDYRNIQRFAPEGIVEGQERDIIGHVVLEFGQYAVGNNADLIRDAEYRGWPFFHNRLSDVFAANGKIVVQ
jgi:hypothetical protein